ncbi:phosphate ABC transporter permease PstA [Aphanothece sacrum]|uniref:Phosphate transport system permease protein PstA n=1 Tax=Aphanothece sacrum FPU1 TaxID=1920663 RepID=A0A401IDM0_APHSA|nr:phosphate ABC transporter permease PstA [Aphanothece sacrum]GBF79352.1 phosphate ABC transporter, inner membrane subunit PstA [Aphanothece sacrum FPU1]GBF86854.1 phosphate ABC transporter, inner membrane subunit PstA [Aphanothece sacrum FPU3]
MVQKSPDDSELFSPLSPLRNSFSLGMTILAFILTFIALLPLFAIVWEITRQGLPQLSWEVFTSLPSPPGVENEANGFANAIVGSLTMVGLAALLSVPLGVMTGIFVSEFAKGSVVANTIRFVSAVLSSVPSVIVGVFAYGVLVITTKKFSAVAGGLALGVIMLPIISLTTEEALKAVPMSYRLGSAALGGARFTTIFRLIIPAALPSITTGVLLAVARAAGETAPLMFTALFSQFWAEGLWNPTPSLPVLIYTYASSPFPDQNAIAWTASLVLLFLVLITNLLSRFIIRQRQS